MTTCAGTYSGEVEMSRAHTHTYTAPAGVVNVVNVQTCRSEAIACGNQVVNGKW